jgi:myo-inositol-1(or 4)-monophosphatase
MKKDGLKIYFEGANNLGLNISNLLNLAIEVAKLAGEYLIKENALVVKRSDDRDTKLEADIESEKIIMNKLSAYFPVLSEEYGGVLSSNGPTWIVDPLDGTVNYSRRIPLNAVSVALWHNGPILGVIYDFNRNELFAGGVGLSAKLNGKDIRVSDTPDKKSAIIFTGFPIANSFETQSLNRFVAGLQSYKKVRLIGSAALSLAWIAAGRGDAYIEEKIRLWDVAAGLAILNAAGGSFRISGNDLLDVHASNGVINY